MSGSCSTRSSVTSNADVLFYINWDANVASLISQSSIISTGTCKIRTGCARPKSEEINLDYIRTGRSAHRVLDCTNAWDLDINSVTKDKMLLFTRSKKSTFIIFSARNQESITLLVENRLPRWGEPWTSPWQILFSTTSSFRGFYLQCNLNPVTFFLVKLTL